MVILNQIIELLNKKPSNHHSTGRLNLAAKMTNFGKKKMRVFTKDLRIETPSSTPTFHYGGQAGEFIR